MNIFKKFNEEQKSQTTLPVEPTDLYYTLKKEEKYSYLRGVQEEALGLWHLRRDEPYTVIKMNTGAGKTLVGLLMLYSKMIETQSKSLYLCPDKQLVNQVIEQSKNYGIPTCQFEEGSNDFPEDFLNDKSILVTTVHKLFNGKNIFDKNRLNVDSILFDDAHRCIEKVFDQFTIRFERDSDVYQKLINLFSDEFRKQEIGSYEGIISGQSEYYLKLPFWTWNDKKEEVIDILKPFLADPETLLFKWDLFVNDFSKYEFYIDSYHIEISPLKCNTKNISTYHNAKHKFAMSATFENDLSLLYNLDFSIDSVLKPIEPKSRKDYGQRLILSPKRYFNSFDNEVLKEVIEHHLRKNENILVIVPTYNDAESWENFGAKKLTVNIEVELDSLRKSKGNFVVITNRYEGIDLSGDVCNVLMLYNHPTHKLLSEKYNESMLYLNTSNIVAQTIEQGMGRTVRSGSDYSVIYLLGGDMLKFLRQKQNFSYLNKHTKRQIEIGLNLLQQDEEIEKNKIASIICETADYCLEQNDDWLEFYNGQMSKIDNEEEDRDKEKLFEIKELERKALQEFLIDNYNEAITHVDEILKKELSDGERAKFLILSANIHYFVDKDLSNNLLIKAKKLSFASFQPFLSKEYQKSLINCKEQYKGAVEYLRRFTNINDAINSIRETILKLSYSNTKSEKFESAVKELGSIMGYVSSRPEKELNQGSDNLWLMDNNTCLVIEAKSEKKHENLISKDDISQLLHSLTWFEERYIHKDNAIYGVTMQYNNRKEATATPGDQIRVIDSQSLDQIKVSLQKYVDFLSQKKEINQISESEISTEFSIYGFDTVSFLGKYLKEIR